VEYVNIYLSGTDTPIMQYLLLTLMTLTQPLVYQALLEFVIQISSEYLSSNASKSQNTSLLVIRVIPRCN
jgi:hypothetical protein